MDRWAWKPRAVRRLERGPASLQSGWGATGPRRPIALRYHHLRPSTTTATPTSTSTIVSMVLNVDRYPLPAGVEPPLKKI